MFTPKTATKHAPGAGTQRLPAPPPPTTDGGEMPAEITPDRIRVRAYQIYLARNGAPGDAESDWAQAERELNGQATPGSSGEDTIADPNVLEIKTRAEAQRPSAAPARGGL